MFNLFAARGLLSKSAAAVDIVVTDLRKRLSLAYFHIFFLNNLAQPVVDTNSPEQNRDVETDQPTFGKDDSLDKSKPATPPAPVDSSTKGLVETQGC